jgi:hypothetical protein
MPKKILTSVEYLADEILPNIIKRKHPKERERKRNMGARTKSPGKKFWLIVYWPTMMLSLLVQHTLRKFS